MAQRRMLTCSVTGAPTMGVELSPGARSAITPEAHAARSAGRKVRTAKAIKPLPFPKRSKAEKEAAKKQG